MKLPHLVIALGAACIANVLSAQESKPATTIKTLKDRASRGSLNDRREMIRGDTGKWNDKATLQHMPSFQSKPQGLSLDEWADQCADKKSPTTADDDNWLIFRSRQLDDNDRAWVEKIERRGNEITVVLNEAIWQGRYNKTFTYYEVVAVNLGKLPPGDYSVRWIVKPLVFDRFEDPGQPKDNWPKDDRPGNAKPLVLPVAFSIRGKQ